MKRMGLGEKDEVGRGACCMELDDLDVDRNEECCRYKYSHKDHKNGAAPILYIRKFTIPEDSTGRRKHQIEHQAGLALLKTGLQQGFGLDLADIDGQIRCGEKGKPYLPAYPHIHFNISHSGDVAVCAVGGSPLGVDVEKIRPVKLHSTKRMLNDRERAFLESCPAERREEALFRFWTLKESYAKALGVGLGMDFTKVGFSFDMEERVAGASGWSCQIQGPEGGLGEGWVFMQMIEGEYVLSFCGRERAARVCFC